MCEFDVRRLFVFTIQSFQGEYDIITDMHHAEKTSLPCLPITMYLREYMEDSE